MGARQSRLADAQAPGEEAKGGFTVSVTPGLVQSLEGGVPPGKPEVVTTREEAEEMAAAYRKGIQDAEGQLRQHIVAQKEQWTQELLEREAQVTAHLEEKVAEFRAKKFTPPQRPVACEEEAAQLVACYREKKGEDGALACRSLVDVYEECARKVVQAIDVTKPLQ